MYPPRKCHSLTKPLTINILFANQFFRRTMFKRSIKIYVVSFFIWFGTLTRLYQGGQYSNTRSSVHQHWTRLSASPTINHHEETSALGAARTTVPRNTSPLFYRLLFKFGAYYSYICCVCCPNICIHTYGLKSV